jgi:thiaminase/transcriptional activator TenA
MTFTDDRWAEIAPIRAQIAEMPFLVELGAGTLDWDTFVGYLGQDALYLIDYSRALALAAAAAPITTEALFWSNGSHNALAVERQMHLSHVTDLSQHRPSPTTTAYTSYLLARATNGGYPVLAAALLPCFWLYADAGDALLAAAGDLAGHRYAEWISTYADPEFATATAQARAIVDKAAEEATVATRKAMTEAFVTASRFEWMFFDAAYRREIWPV